MKKLLAILLVICMLATVLAACSDKDKDKDDNWFVEDSVGLTYQLNEDGLGYTVIDIGTCTDTDLVIPKSYNGLPVTGIGERAFYCCSSLKSVTICDSVTSIGGDAFYNCSSLTGVYIADIAKWCNISCSNYYANPLYYAKNLYFNGELVTDLVIPEGVTSIGSGAFSGCSSLKTVTIPDSVTSIGSAAFGHCNNLTSVTIGNGVSEIGYGAFRSCGSLASVIIGNGVTNMGSCSFADCGRLVRINYSGTMSQWSKISSEGFFWNLNMGYYIVNCTDGRLTESGAKE